MSSPESSHISIPDTGDNGPIWRWFFTLSNLFRLVVVVSLERLFILNFLGMQYTLDKVGAKCPKEILQFCTLIWLKISLKIYSIYTWNNRVQLICTLGCNQFAPWILECNVVQRCMPQLLYSWDIFWWFWNTMKFVFLDIYGYKSPHNVQKEKR